MSKPFTIQFIRTHDDNSIKSWGSGYDTIEETIASLYCCSYFGTACILENGVITHAFTYPPGQRDWERMSEIIGLDAAMGMVLDEIEARTGDRPVRRT